MLLCAILWGLTGPSALLTSFESPTEIADIGRSSTEVSLATEHVTNGQHSLKVAFQATEWPHIQWSPKSPLDWSGYGGLGVDVYNPNQETIVLGVRIDDNLAADGWNHSRTSTFTLKPHVQQSIAIAMGTDPMSVGMRALPTLPVDQAVTANGGGEFASSHIVSYQLFLHNPPAGTTLFFDNLRALPARTMEGIVDPFGQFTGSSWPGKVANEKDFDIQHRAERADIQALPVLKERDRFGGWQGSEKLPATGFFRTARVANKWTLVDPDGRIFFSLGVDVVGQWESTLVTGREKMFSWLPKPGTDLDRFSGMESTIHMGPTKSGKTFSFYRANLYRKYGPDFLKNWVDTSLARLPSWGFNTIGNWSEDSLYRNQKVPYVATGGVSGNHATVSSGTDYWGRMPDPFDPQFASDALQSLTPLINKVKGDPWCLGYFVDNELSWAGDGAEGRYGLAIGSMSEPPTSPARQAFVQRLKASYGDIGAVNSAWGVHFDSWDTLRLPKVLNEAQRKDAGLFVKEFARRYFRTIRDVLKSGDKDHLYLGCRFAWRTHEAEDAAAEYCDVVSFNIYAPKLDDSWKALTRLGKPCIIGEFHFGALDRGMFHPGLVSTPNQVARAVMYEDYVRSVLESPSFVGCHWFQYVDEPLTGRSFDGENYNIGLVSVTDTPYKEMVEAARRIHQMAYKIRFGTIK